MCVIRKAFYLSVSLQENWERLEQYICQTGKAHYL